MKSTIHRIRLGFGLLSLQACIQVVDPCLEGSRWSESAQACVHTESTDASTSGDDREDSGTMDGSSQVDGAMVEQGGPDASTAMDAHVDTSSDASPMLDAAGDATTDANAVHQDAAPTDSQAPEPDSSTPQESPSCSDEDEAAWRDFHLSGELINAIKECYAGNASCLLGLCPLDDCLRQKAQVKTCNACVTSEVECMVAHCVSDCGSNDTNDRCRACACAQGCVTQFNSCAPTPIDVCTDCQGDTCINQSLLPPELIMVIVGIAMQ